MQLHCLIMMALSTSAAAGLWSFKVQKPFSGFLGDRPNILSDEKPISGFLGERPILPDELESEKEQRPLFKVPDESQQNELSVLAKIAMQQPHNSTREVELPSWGQRSQEIEVQIPAAPRDGKEQEPGAASAQKAASSATAVKTKKTETVKNETDEATARRPRKPRKSMEETLIQSLEHSGNTTTIACVTHCRYGEEVRHTWQECLSRCVDNNFMRSALLKMLPKESHAAVSMDTAVPASLQSQLDRHRQRAAEL